MNQATRVGVALLGLLLLVRGLSGWSDVMAPLVEISRSGVRVELTHFFVALGSGAVSAAPSIVPAALLIAWRGKIADRLFPEAAAPFAPPSASALYATGCALLAIWFAVQGIAALLGSLATALAATRFPASEAAGSFAAVWPGMTVRGAVELTGAALLHRHARRLAKR
jgi:hypothetical protein